MQHAIKFLVCFSLFFIAACGGDPEPKVVSEDLVEIPEIDTNVVMIDTTSEIEDEGVLAENKEEEEEKTEKRASVEKSTKTTKKEVSSSSMSKKERDKVKEMKEKIDAGEVVKKKNLSRAKISFEQTSYNFGTIAQGDKINYAFKFTNTGTADLIIENTKASCGCTQPGFSFLPIAPGKSSEITVTYNSTGKLGPQKPNITVVSNSAKPTMKLYLEGMVLPKENIPGYVPPADATPKAEPAGDIPPAPVPAPTEVPSEGSGDSQ